MELILLGSLFVTILGWGIFQYVNHRKSGKIIDHLLEENCRLKSENIRATIEAQERERREIGQDLHDELGSTLLTMKMNLSLIEKQGLFIFESNDALKELKYSLEGAIDYVKSVSRITSPAFLENFGLSRAVIQMVKRINSSCVAKVEFTEIGDTLPLSKEKQLHVFRIIQEVINNALRYASPWRIFVTIYWNQSDLIVEIRDDGYNYRFSEKYQTAGLGINNILNRAGLIGAKFTNENLPQGNVARIHLSNESINE
ncbi:MAG TPA: histidine kinase [Cyclobacteriaceae bacterium]|nr:histidine kinase [Cyclobacteriaceae bacterium]